jgi:hypothetical protein
MSLLTASILRLRQGSWDLIHFSSNSPLWPATLALGPFPFSGGQELYSRANLQDNFLMWMIVPRVLNRDE